jgi:hypothetical protein
LFHCSRVLHPLPPFAVTFQCIPFSKPAAFISTINASTTSVARACSTPAYLCLPRSWLPYLVPFLGTYSSLPLSPLFAVLRYYRLRHYCINYDISLGHDWGALSREALLNQGFRLDSTFDPCRFLFNPSHLLSCKHHRPLYLLLMFLNPCRVHVAKQLYPPSCFPYHSL